MRARPTSNPVNRFLSSTMTYDDPTEANARVEVFDDATRSILAHNDSPDVGFSWSVNPYRGCQHACAYCYARPTHEYLGLGAGTDFDTKIMVKRDAPRLLREAFEKPSWKGELVMFSGVTDCYQPVESKLGLTRACLEVCAEYRNPVGVITKGVLIERDLELLQRLSREARLHVRVSVPFWDADDAREIEPFVATPQRRIETIARLADAGISVGVNVAPIIPGLTDDQIPDILKAARNAGATHASHILLRLPGSVLPVFDERVNDRMPMRAEKILGRVRDTRDGAMNDPKFGSRMKGTGNYAAPIHQLFESTARRLGFESWPGAPREPSPFRRPSRSKQLGLFDVA